MEHVTTKCHLRTVPLFILVTSANFSVPATTASITLMIQCRGPEVIALSTTLILN